MIEETITSGERPAEEEPLHPGDDVEQFRVRRLLGRGGMGEVYLARDLVLGRLVALKLIRRERLGPTDIARFFKEARATAKLGHPNIVTIHAVGTHRSRPYLALEYVDGETLAERLARGPLSVDETLRIGRALADALAHAHAAGVLHCDLKPNNVVFARDGRLRVVDFGLATDASSPAARTLAGTPGYMAPEQWTNAPLTDRVDVWALGVLLFECLEGRRPFGPKGERTPAPPLSREQVPAEAVRAIRECLSHEPALRPNAVECRLLLDAALSPLSGLDPDECPFRGLLPFEDRHAELFFGREAEIAELLERLRTEALIPVIGPSGIGKSSFVHAGVVSRLRAQGGWTVLSFRPGSAPLRTLAHRISTAGSGGSTPAVPHVDAEVNQLAARIRATPSVAALGLAALAASNRGRVLLVVDQLEELFTHVSDAEERRAFLDAVLLAADDVDEPVRVIFTVRDDFLRRIPQLRSLFVLGPLDKEALRRTIVEPLKKVGYDFDEPRTVDAILSELEGGPGELPLLQFALRRLWGARDEARRLLLHRVYEQFGGVAGALSDHADKLLDALQPAELRAAKTILLRLVSPEGTRRIHARQLLSEGLGEIGDETIARLTDARLLLQRRSKDSGELTVEIAHESLIARWPRLVLWLEESIEERAFAAELDEAAKLWIRRGRRPEETWSGLALATARRRAAELDLAFSRDAGEFLGAGTTRERQRIRRRSLTLGATASLLLAITLGALVLANAFRERELEARRQRDELVRAGANLGEFELRLEPFDWDAAQLSARAVSISELPDLSFALHRSDGGGLEPGEPLDREQVRISAETSTNAAARVFRVESPGMRVFLRIDGRGRRGERCPPSWLELRALPGYAERKRGARPVLRVPVPTCRASASDQIEVPEGEFIFGGVGEPPLARPEEAEPERTVSLPRYRLDRTEVSNARFATFASLAKLTGEDLPNYPDDAVLPGAAAPDHPVTGISARTAQAFCRYQGGRLPTFLEWVKAVRGGLQLGPLPNPSPRRLYPWTGRQIPRGINFDGEADGCNTTCSLRRGPPQESAYGARDLIGNVQEWGIGWQRPWDGKLLPILGGGFRSEAGDSLASSAAANMREPRYFDFQTGVRCAMPIEERAP